VAPKKAVVPVKKKAAPVKKAVAPTKKAAPAKKVSAPKKAAAPARPKPTKPMIQPTAFKKAAAKSRSKAEAKAVQTLPSPQEAYKRDLPRVGVGTGKRRVVVSYKNLSPELLELLKEKYPFGWNDYVMKINKTETDFFHAIMLDTKDACYLIKVDVKVDTRVGDDDIIIDASAGGADDIAAEEEEDDEDDEDERPEIRHIGDDEDFKEEDDDDYDDTGL